MKNSVLFSTALMFAVAISEAQIPNSGFENWTNMGGYNEPDGWSTLNSMTSPTSTYTCVKGTPGNPGSSYLKLTSKTVSGMGVMPGIAVSGMFDQSTMQPLTGFPFTGRPQQLTGSWQHMVLGGSQGFIDVQLTRWDANMQMRMPVASAHYVLKDMAMGWEDFSVSLNYVDGNNPDSCMITLSANGDTAADNDYLYIDNLAFTGDVTGILENHYDAGISMSPNPATNNLSLDLSALNDKIVSVEIFDVSGKRILNHPNVEAGSNAMIDISDLPKGNYALNIISAQGTLKRNFIKQ